MTAHQRQVLWRLAGVAAILVAAGAASVWYRSAPSEAIVSPVEQVVQIPQVKVPPVTLDPVNSKPVKQWSEGAEAAERINAAQMRQRREQWERGDPLRPAIEGRQVTID